MSALRKSMQDIILPLIIALPSTLLLRLPPLPPLLRVSVLRGKKNTHQLSTSCFAITPRLAALGQLLFKQRDILAFDVVEGGLQAVTVIDHPDLGFHGRGLAHGGKKLVGSHPDEGIGALLLFDLGRVQDPLAGKECQHGIADPGLGAFFVFGHLVV